MNADWSRRTLLLVGSLVALSPLFAWAAGVVGYAEPMGNLAARFGADAHVYRTVPSLFPDYRVAGFGPYAGTFVSGVAGVAVTAAVASGVGQMLADPTER
ncbi:PDGLE domain-containing protein [Halopelagius inordinatus]|uniref:PDGLE domain-containing protein n=1 Tax=Halopelagius inordinatus TaxID=553467 RepID=UPI000B883901|nr:PDGLE domain-containing protein [Halopelagius inordinatus]